MTFHQEMQLSILKSELDDLRKKHNFLPISPKTPQDYLLQSGKIVDKINMCRKEIEGYSTRLNSISSAEEGYLLELQVLKIQSEYEILLKKAEENEILCKYAEKFDFYTQLKNEIAKNTKMVSIQEDPNYTPGKSERGFMSVNFFEIFSNKDLGKIKSFCDVHKYKITDDGGQRLKFTSEENKNITVDVSNTDVSIKTPKTDEEKSCMKDMIKAMISIYLKGIEGMNVVTHSVSSDDPEVKKHIEVELASTLKKAGALKEKINGKNLFEILGEISSLPTVSAHENPEEKTTRKFTH